MKNVKRNFLDRFMENQARKKNEKAKLLELKTEKQKTEEFVQKVRELLQLLIWIDKQLSNRKVRKSFWKDFFNNTQIRPQIMQQLIDQYIEHGIKIDEEIKKCEK